MKIPEFTTEQLIRLAEEAMGRNIYGGTGRPGKIWYVNPSEWNRTLVCASGKWDPSADTSAGRSQAIDALLAWAKSEERRTWVIYGDATNIRVVLYLNHPDPLTKGSWCGVADTLPLAITRAVLAALEGQS